MAGGINEPLQVADAFLLTKCVLAHNISQRCSDEQRSGRMERAVAQFCEQLGLESPAHALARLQQLSLGWTEVDRRLLFVDVWSVSAFSPHEIKVAKRDQRIALTELAMAVDSSGVISDVERAEQELAARERRMSTAKVVGAAAGGALLMGTGAFVAAPLLGSLLASSTMGLSGAAATSAGLAALGGGTLAAGGAGVAGGVLVVTSVGAAAGGTLSLGGTALYQLGSRQARYELRKMELKFTVAMYHSQADLRVAQRFATRLHGEIETLKADLDEERLFSDRRSKKIGQMEELLEQLQKSERWMRDRLEADG